MRAVAGSDLRLLSLGEDEHLHKTSDTEFKGKHIQKESKRKEGRKEEGKGEEGRERKTVQTF